MIELATIFRQYGPAYRAKFGDRLLPSHRRAMADIEACRTEVLGGHVFYCDGCQQADYSYHSCQNRHCPKCQHQAGQIWLSQQQDLLLPLPYFMLTFTWPEPLRALARSNQTVIYDLLFRCSAEATQQLARDPRFIGGQIGLIGVLQTWTRDLNYHPHIHYLVPGGGLAADGSRWIRSRKNFLLPLKPLAILFRAKFRDALKQTELFDLVPAEVWHKPWVVHCQPVGRGQAALKYLAPYIFRVALSNNRILALEDEQVTFRYRDAQGQPQTCTLHVFEFIRRFLQHVLPKGFKKVRYYGFFSPGCRPTLARIRALLQAPTPTNPSPVSVPDPTTSDRCCPTCGQPLRWLARLPPLRGPPLSLAPSNLTPSPATVAPTATASACLMPVVGHHTARPAPSTDLPRLKIAPNMPFPARCGYNILSQFFA
jgi:hypothetical protein